MIKSCLLILKGVVISNGPGDPQKCPDTINTAKKLIENNIPTLGICLGAQIIGIAGNTETYKLKYGHRGQNKPCVNHGKQSSLCYKSESRLWNYS